MSEKIVLMAISAAVGWFLSWQRFIIVENANLIADHIKDIERFADQLRSHWLQSYADENSIKQQKLDIAEIKSLYTSITCFYGEAEKRLNLLQLKEYQTLQLKLFEVGLGGEFESLGRDFDQAKAVECTQITSELIQNLRIARRQQYKLITNCFLKIVQALGIYRPKS